MGESEKKPIQKKLNHKVKDLDPTEVELPDFDWLVKYCQYNPAKYAHIEVPFPEIHER